VVKDVISSDDCKTKIACELPNGDIRYDLTAEECVSLPGSCSGECPVPTCRPYSKYFSSACYVYNVSDFQNCTNLPGESWFYYDYYIPICISFDISQSDCEKLRSSYNTEFTTCEMTNASNCNSKSLNFIQLLYLECGVSDFGPCNTQELCETIGGTCSDSFFMLSDYDYQITDDNDQETMVFSFGLCSSSGLSGMKTYSQNLTSS
jgi:hypothetical protein